MLIGIILALIGIGIAYLIQCPKIVDANEVAVVVRLGNPRRFVTSGPCLIAWPFDKLVRYSTTQQELELGEVSILTKAEKGTEKHNAVAIKANTALYWFWPQGQGLLETIKVVSNPFDKAHLKNVFQEPTLDLARSVGITLNWEKFVQGVSFDTKVADTLARDPNHALVKARLDNVRIITTGIKLPPELEEKISAQEVGRLARLAEQEKITQDALRIEKVGKATGKALKEKGIAEADAKKRMGESEADARQKMGGAEANATKRAGEADADARKKMGEADADARIRLFEAIGDKVDLESLLRFAEAAQGPSNTLWVLPSEITGVINRSLERKVNPLRDGEERTTLEEALRNIEPIIDGLSSEAKTQALNALREFARALAGMS